MLECRVHGVYQDRTFALLKVAAMFLLDTSHESSSVNECITYSERCFCPRGDSMENRCFRTWDV